MKQEVPAVRAQHFVVHFNAYTVRLKHKKNLVKILDKLLLTGLVRYWASKNLLCDNAK